MTNPEPSSESNKIPISSQISLSELVNIDSISPAAAGLENNEGITPKEQRKNFNNKISGILAISLWAILAFVILIHLGSVICINVYSERPPEAIELRTSNINNTANTIYPFLTTLVTAATGYYFMTFTRFDSNNDN